MIAPSSAANRFEHPRWSKALPWALVLFAAAWLAIWIWSRICVFPENAWNDIRLAPTLALSRGLAVYPTAEHGVISTWTYGPLPILFFWPASWASTAAGAIQIAAVLNALIVVLPIAAVCRYWPVEPSTRTGWARAVAFLFCLAFWPQRSFDYHQSDNLAIACALLGNLVLLRATLRPHYWIAAALAVSAVACKQIAVGIPLAQLTWLGIVRGPRSAVHHALRCAGAAFAVGAAMAAVFGRKELWFVLFQMPARFPWGKGLGSWLVDLAPQLGWQIAVPAIVIVAFRGQFARPALLLPALAWAFAVPLGFVALLKQGGDVNSLHGALLWLPAVATVVMCSVAYWPRVASPWIVAALIALAAMSRIVADTRTALRPQLDAYHAGEALAKANPHGVWFPWNPSISLYCDGQYYHDEDGLHVRLACDLPIDAQELRSHLPAQFGAIAVRSNWMTWGIARQLLPPEAELRTVTNWTLWLAHNPAAGHPPPPPLGKS